MFLYIYQAGYDGYISIPVSYPVQESGQNPTCNLQHATDEDDDQLNDENLPVPQQETTRSTDVISKQQHRNLNGRTFKQISRSSKLFLIIYMQVFALLWTALMLGFMYM